jgi:hypothetical protein
MLEIKQGEHQTGGEPRATATPDTGNLKTGAKEIVLRNRSCGSEVSDDQRFNSRLKFIPWNPTSKNNQRMPRIDHFFEGLTIQVLIDHEPKSPSF